MDQPEMRVCPQCGAPIQGFSLQESNDHKVVWWSKCGNEHMVVLAVSRLTMEELDEATRTEH